MRNNQPVDVFVQGLLDGLDPCARELFLSCRGIVELVAGAYTDTGEPLDDLLAEGYIGLKAAVVMNRPWPGATFQSYAVKFVIGQIRNSMKDKGRTGAEPCWIKELGRYDVDDDTPMA